MAGMKQLLAALLIVTGGLTTRSPQARAQDNAVWGTYPDTFKQELRRRVDATTRPAEPTAVLMLDPASVDAPKSPGEFTQAWHRPPTSQGLTGQCWAYAATSFLESEVHRLTGRQMTFSVAFTWYWEFVEKARGFVRSHGESAFNKGSEPDAVLSIWREHGAVPAEAYRGLPAGQDVPQDAAAYREIAAHLADVKAAGRWDEQSVVSAVRRILDRHFGPPPEEVSTDTGRMSAADYLKTVVKLDPDNYVSVMSFMQQPYDQWCELQVPDNWRHSRRYYNVRLDDYVRVIREAARKGYTACFVQDDTEPGFCFREGFAVVPTFDIPAALVDDGARQMRFSNEATADDHAVHLVGWREMNDRFWYLIKDSGTRAWNSPHQGYMFYREDFVRLKTLAALMHRDAIEAALGRPIGPPPDQP